MKKKVQLICSSVISNSLYDRSIAKALTDIGFMYPEIAWNNLLRIFEIVKKLSEVPDSVLLKIIINIVESFEPDRALNNIEKCLSNAKSPEKLVSIIQKDEKFLKAIVTLFSGSQYLSDFVIKDENNIDFLINWDIPKDKDTLYKELESLLSESHKPEQNYALVRQFKKREYLRAGLKDLLRGESFSRISEELSDIADVCLECIYEICERELIKKYGIPYYNTPDGEKRPCEFSIISLGKLGGRELNFSSDIDILYLYSSDDGETDAVSKDMNQFKAKLKLHEFYVKLSQMITNALSEITEEGDIFRVDLRLRPEGKKGDIAYSLRSYEIYYESWGETWERQALIKARISAGSQTLGDEFIKMIQPFVYRRFLDFTAIEEIKKVKERIDANLIVRRKEKDNVKLGYGGIREIEFFVQSLQLIFGGKEKSIQEKNTLCALSKLLEANLIDKSDYEKLVNAYIFLRELENRLQLSHAIQKHIIPEDTYERYVLARKMGISVPKTEEVADKLIKLYNSHIKNVREIYNSLFYKEKEEKLPYYIITSEDKDAAFSYLKDFDFKDPQKAISTIVLLREGESFTHPTEKSKMMFDELLPDILKVVSTLSDPDLALTNFERFVSSGSLHKNVYSFMLENKKVCELLLTLFGTSMFLSDILIRHPGSFDAILNPDEWMVSKSEERLYEELSQSLAKSPIFEKKMNELRRFKKIEELKVGLRDFSFEVDLMDTFKDLSNLSDACLECAFEISQKELSRMYGFPQIVGDSKKVKCPLTIAGLGKLGGQELDFGSDLDLIFVYEDEGTTSGKNETDGESIPNYIYFQKLYDRIYNYISGITDEGYAYKIDLRLRPEGKKGATVLSFKRFDEYFQSRAEIWERQALIKTRIVAGDKELGSKFVGLVRKFVYESEFGKEDISKIAHIRERMENELAGEDEFKKDFKVGYGGIADIEFIVQTLQLKYGKQFQELRIPNTTSAITELKNKKILNKTQSERLLKAYKFLRRIENRIRVVHDTSLHSFALSPEEIESLAVRMGYRDKKGRKAGELLLTEYKNYTEEIRGIYKEIFKRLLSESNEKK